MPLAQTGRRLARLLGVAAALIFLPAGARAGDSPPGIDPRLIGSWKFSNGFGIVVFHTSFANGDFSRTVYDHGKLEDTSKGRWSSGGNVFHIVFLKRATPARPGWYANIEQHVDQGIIEISADAYVVREASAAGDKLMRWVRIGGSDPADFKADEPDVPATPAPSPAGQGTPRT
jgi:hypothetical protein